MGSVFKPPKPRVPKPDIAGDIGQYVGGYTQALPQIIDAEGQYRPQFMGLNLGDISQFLGGVGGQEGLFGLSALAQQQSGQNLYNARAQELANMTGQAGAFRGFAQALSPESWAQVEAAQKEAQRATAASMGLTPQEKRIADQTAREAFASRGMLDSNASIVGEAMNRESYLSGKRAEAAGARQTAFNAAQQFYTAPGLQALGSTPLSYQAGQQMLGLGLGAIGSGRPQMINPDVGVNVGMANRANQTQANIAQTSAQGSIFGGLLGGIGSVFGGMAQGGTGIFSDRRLKENIRRVGSTEGGLPVYIYNYKGDNTQHMGVMAQDVEKVKPEAVTEVGGYKAVYYGMIE